MDSIINFYLQSLEIQEPQIHEQIALFPIKSQANPGPDYITLSEALEKNLLVVKEIGPEGSVPELKATNNGEQPVLLLDGEELRGAKQNRVLNTTIMIGPKTSVVIPVSCVEAHRWHGQNLRMEKSNHVAAHRIRRAKMEQVRKNLEKNRRFQADQSEIWNEVRELAFIHQIDSPTEAMSDIYEAREKDLKNYLKAFSLIPAQKGLLVFIEGKPAGLEFISRETAFSQNYQKLLKSYVLEALSLKYERQFLKEFGLGKKDEQGQETRWEPSADEARAFIEKARECEEKKFDSVGVGFSWRYRGEGLIGAALEVDGSIPHFVFFALADGTSSASRNEDRDNFQPFRIRRRRLSEN